MIIQSTRYVPSLRSAFFGVFSTVALLSSSIPTFAGVKEIAAVTAQLPTGVTIGAATSGQLVTAFGLAVTANPALKPGIMAGEILRLATADVGGPLASAITGGSLNALKTVVATDAIRTAGTGRAPKVVNVPDFSAIIAPTSAESITLAKLVKSSRSGQGATLGGFASTLADDAAKQLFANASVFSDKAFAGAATDIANYIGATTTSGAAFATAVAGAPLNVKLAESIVVGTVAGKPLEAGAIAIAAKTIVVRPPAGAKPATFLLASRATTLARSISAVADIEQIQKVGETLASVITLSRTGAIVTTLAKAIVAKTPFSILTQDQTALTSRNDNKIDELGELAAYMLNELSKKADFQKTDGKLASKAVFAMVTSILKATKLKIKTGQTPGPGPGLVARYVLGSVALTLEALNAAGGLSAAAALVVVNDLKNPIKNKALAKLGLITQSDFNIAVNAGSSEFTTPTGRFENGTVALGTNGLALTDPETNSRNF